MRIKTCGVDCVQCDCGRSSNECVFKESKIRGLKKKLGLIKPVQEQVQNTGSKKPKLNKKDKKAARKKGKR